MVVVLKVSVLSFYSLTYIRINPFTIRIPFEIHGNKFIAITIILQKLNSFRSFITCMSHGIVVSCRVVGVHCFMNKRDNQFLIHISRLGVIVSNIIPSNVGIIPTVIIHKV